MNNDTKILLVVLFCSILCNYSYGQNPQKLAERPNIILIMADDLGWGDVGFNGNKIIETPFLDDMASNGTIFNRFYAASPVCSPTRASCLTGRNPYRQGIYSANVGHLKTDENTLPEILKEAGYSTGIFGKWHLGTLTTKQKDGNRGYPEQSDHYSIPSSHGFDSYCVTESKVPTYDPLIYPKIFDSAKGESLRYGWSSLKKQEKINIYGTSYWIGKEKKADPAEISGDDTRIIIDHVIPFIQKSLQENKPFFTVIWLHTPHLPVVTDQIHRSRYANYSHQEQLYYGSISAMDEQIGRLNNFLNKMGISDNTMIWFASDNGPENNTPGLSGQFRGKKRDLYEGGLRVPAFCLWPNKIPAGKIINTPAVTSDYLPSILSILDLKYPNRTLDGINLFDIILGNQTERKSPIGFQYPNSMSWVTDTYKIIKNSRDAPFEMYNLMDDPSEKIDIISKNPELETQLKTALFKWVESCKKSEKGLDYVK